MASVLSALGQAMTNASMSQAEYDREYPVGSAKRQEFERIHGPWCGHPGCVDQAKCVEGDDPRIRNVARRIAEERKWRK